MRLIFRNKKPEDSLTGLMGRLLIKKKTCLYFLDEMSLTAVQLVHLSHLKTRLFLDQ